MARSKARHSHGSKFSLNTGTAGAFEQIAEVTSIGGPDFSGDDTEITHLDSDGAMKEFAPGLVDPGEITLDLNFTRDVVVKLMANLRVERQGKIEWPEGSTWTATVYLKGVTNETPLNDKISCTATFKVTSLPAFVAGAL